MKLTQAVLITIALTLPSLAQADARAEAERLLEITNMQQVLNQSVSQMLDIQLQQNPSLVPYRGVMLKFLKKHMSYASLKGELVEMYTEAFTASELKEINAFYETDVGKKSVRLMPTLMAKGAQMGAARVQANIGELHEMMRAEEAGRQK